MLKGIAKNADEGLWVRILASTRAIAFPEYARFIESNGLDRARGGTTDYQSLRDATRIFLKKERERTEPHPNLHRVEAEANARLRRPFEGAQLRGHHAPLVELIWSYWHEEGMLVQTVDAIGRRFENRLAPEGRDPLQALEIDQLRPLSNLLSGFVQDEQRRLGVARRAYEYQHHYGLSVQVSAIKRPRPAERRTKFLESFHNLLSQCVQFYKEDDDTTRVADGFPVLNALKETHLLLTQGAHNQFGDLPETAREEMLMEMWLLGRPETREFLSDRAKVPYSEPWMDRVDHMKSLQGWTDVSVVHFHDLAVFGEQILLSIRFSAWSTLGDPATAAAWARFWQQELQGYVHAYRATTGVDLTS